MSSSRRQLSRPRMTEPQGSHESIGTRQSVDRLNVARSLYGADAGFHVRRLPHSDGLRRASIQSIDRSKFWSPSDLMRQSSLQSLKFITTLPPCHGVVLGSSLRVVVSVACYKPKFVIIYLFTLLQSTRVLRHPIADKLQTISYITSTTH